MLKEKELFKTSEKKETNSDLIINDNSLYEELKTRNLSIKTIIKSKFNKIPVSLNYEKTKKIFYKTINSITIMLSLLLIFGLIINVPEEEKQASLLLADLININILIISILLLSTVGFYFFNKSLDKINSLKYKKLREHFLPDNFSKREKVFIEENYDAILTYDEDKIWDIYNKPRENKREILDIQKKINIKDLLVKISYPEFNSKKKELILKESFSKIFPKINIDEDWLKLINLRKQMNRNGDISLFFKDKEVSLLSLEQKDLQKIIISEIKRYENGYRYKRPE